MVELNPGWITAAVAAGAFDIVFPLVVAFIAGRRLHVSWRYFGFGAMVFLAAQILTRLPAVAVIQTLFATQLRSPPLMWVWLVTLSVTAGLFEEIGRFLGYRWLMRGEDKIWPKAIMYGLGHGGLESMVVAGGGSLLSVVGLVVALTRPPDALSQQARAQVDQLLTTLRSQPDWFPLLGAWERVAAMGIQVALSTIVLQVFRRARLRWLWLAVLLHALVDGVTVGAVQLAGPGTVRAGLLSTTLVTFFGVSAVWLVVRLREPINRSRSGEQVGSRVERGLLPPT